MKLATSIQCAWHRHTQQTAKLACIGFQQQTSQIYSDISHFKHIRKLHASAQKSKVQVAISWLLIFATCYVEISPQDLLWKALIHCLISYHQMFAASFCSTFFSIAKLILRAMHVLLNKGYMWHSQVFACAFMSFCKRAANLIAANLIWSTYLQLIFDILS